MAKVVTLNSQLESKRPIPSRYLFVQSHPLSHSHSFFPLAAFSAGARTRFPASAFSTIEENNAALAPLLLQAPKVGFLMPPARRSPSPPSSPAANLELRALQKRLPEITNFGATLVAVSLEPAGHSLDTIQKNELTFEVLSDKESEVARKLGIFYIIDNAIKDISKNVFKVDLEKWNDEKTGWGLPLPGTFRPGW
ncbi:hypothetical protein BC937DRAFT_87940 [Endogone sp. FLAS-F59071]|nr:hypothetical protein BC937DRAFT_87940 [Endogone sp. FLAS-F59071]|eukprot:RUS19144.1 hypothetical protein BC937DRAFT_87940 [Endogone sp. FLAS-F59071]